MRKKEQTILILALTILPLVGCESKTATGVLAGGALGAGIGGIAGGGQGALIGSAAGVIAGGLIGAALDENERANLKKQSPQTYRRIDQGERLSVNDVINMSKSHINDQKIIELMRKTSSRYNLNNYQVERLRNAGVSEEVINYMLYST